MSKILDLAQDFETRSKQQADDIETAVTNAFEKHLRAITKELDSNELSLRDAIQDHHRMALGLLSKRWLGPLIFSLLLLSSMSGILWYQGNLIAERQATISKQQATIASLKLQGGGLITNTCEDDNEKRRLCIKMIEGEYGDGYRIPEGY